MHDQVEDEENILRNKDEYENRCKSNNPHETGIKDIGIWNEIPSYHVTDNLLLILCMVCMKRFVFMRCLKSFSSSLNFYNIFFLSKYIK